MKLRDTKRQLNEIRESVSDVMSLMDGDGYYAQAKFFLQQSAQNLSDDNVSVAVNFIKRAKESAIKENDIMLKLKDAKLLIDKKLTGANPDEALRFHEDSIKLLQQGKVEEAERTSENAKINAQPSPAYLLQKARNYYNEGLDKYQNEEFTKAIDAWKKGIEEYNRAMKIAEETKDQNMMNNIESAISKSNNHINDAEVAFDNRKMVNLVESSDKRTDSVKEMEEQHRYDDVLSALKKAESDLESAIEIAKNRNFHQDINKIDKRIENNLKMKDYYMVEKGKYMLGSAVEIINENPEKSEKELYEILKYLDSLDIKSENLETLKTGCKKDIIQSKLAQAKKTMKEAEELYEKEQFYDAREVYEKTQDFLGDVEDEAGNFDVKSVISDIRKFRTICIENRDSCNSQLFNLSDAPQRRLITTRESGEFVVPASKIDLPLPMDDNRLKRLNRDYEVKNYLGGGGFADVYLAKWKNKNLEVALKIPRELTANAEDVFFKEISHWEKLKHRNIVRLIKPRVTPIPHLVIEYVGGSTLDKLLLNPRVDIKKTCRIAFDIARGLEYAHSQSIIHCDLKPKNILLSTVGEAKITDFGIAKTVATTLGSGGRTLIYAAPEQIDGIPDYCTDVYQLGLIMYQMITGTNPFDVGNEDEIEEAIKETIPPPPSTIVSDAKPLDGMIMECLEKDMKKRPALRYVRETLYDYMKRYHGESLHITKDNKSYVRMAFQNAFYAAKYGDIVECINHLKKAQGKIINIEQKDNLCKFIVQIEELKEDKVDISLETISEIENFLKQTI